jgi:alpha-L-fucosidase
MAIFLLLAFGVEAQDCTLGIGGKNTGAIISNFQLNASQKILMDSLRGHYTSAEKKVVDAIQRLFKEHPQSSEEDLLKLAEKYKALQQELLVLAKETDTKLLSAFNERQYQRYLLLCKEALREPIKVVPKVYQDSIAPK